MDIYSFFQHNGFSFKKETITNFYLSLITKPFVILSGISGSGKSKIADLFSEFVTEDEKQIEFFSVKPSWTNDKALMGYHNILDNRYHITPLIKLIIRAKLNPDKPFFLILDEMNLAKVEHYFSDFLSYLESRRIEYGINDIDADTTFASLLNEKLKDESISLSEAIILSALDIMETQGVDIFTTHLPISTYRENRFSKWWKENRYGGSPQNWTPQYRTELNQGPDKRLASRLFDGGNGKYRLKRSDELSIEDNEIIEKYKRLYSSLRTRIKQQKIKLHNSTDLLLSSKTTIDNKKKTPGNFIQDLYDKSSDTYFVPSEIELPLNLFIIGTVNIDESTYMFSPKVLDRANTIEFNDVDVFSLLDVQAFTNNVYNDIHNENFVLKEKSKLEMKIQGIPHSIYARGFFQKDEELFKILIKILDVLKKYNLHFGYRVINEISLYMRNTEVYVEDFAEKKNIALDIQILQKILPKFHGSIQKLWSPLNEVLQVLLKKHININYEEDLEFEKYLSLIFEREIKNIYDISNADYLNRFRFPRSAKKIIHMLNSLKNHGFVSFIE